MTTITIVHMSFDELCQCAVIEEERVLYLIDHGVVRPTAGQRRQEWLFSATAVSVLEKAERIHRDLAVDWDNIPLVLGLLEELSHLRSENSHLKQRLSRFVLGDD